MPRPGFKPTTGQTSLPTAPTSYQELPSLLKCIRLQRISKTINLPVQNNYFYNIKKTVGLGLARMFVLGYFTEMSNQ